MFQWMALSQFTMMEIYLMFVIPSFDFRLFSAMKFYEILWYLSIW
jgi:hypothetical protein